MGGTNTINQTGTYGTKGVPDAANVPGARYGSISWSDSSGNLWLFGGYGYGSAAYEGRLNDLWRYEPPQCLSGSDCLEDYECVEGECVPVVTDNPPVITAGPYLAAGWWPLLPTSVESTLSWMRIMMCCGSSVMILYHALVRARTLQITRQSAAAAGQRFPLRSMLPREEPGLRCRWRACRTPRMPSGLR